MSKKARLDVVLVEQGHFASREQAKRAVMAGEVRLGDRVLTKSSIEVEPEAALSVAAPPKFVGRGGLKLEGALDHFAIDPAGMTALDIGASTGGFTDCLLQRDAAHVIAVDVAYGALDWNLRGDPRVTIMERCNARSLRSNGLAYLPDLIVIDVSFISLTKVLPAVLACASPRFDCLALVKPQFEVGRANVGKGGVIREPELRRGALVDVGRSGRRLGASVLGYASSGLPGPKGNLETFVWLAEGGRGGVDDLDRAAREVEP